MEPAMSKRMKTVLTIVLGMLGSLGCCVGVGGYLLFFGYPAWMNEHFTVDETRDPDGAMKHTLLIGKTNHGEQYVKPPAVELVGQPQHDFSRLATTYYHRNGPVGRAMETMNWFPGPENTYWADARMPASLIGQIAPLGGLPLTPMVGVWSEPPIGKVFLAEGGIASYGRPYQWIDFYERNPEIVSLSSPPNRQPVRFSFIEDARARGAYVCIIEGLERKALAEKGPRDFYKVLVVELLRGGTSFLKQSLVSEDLMTKEAMALYFAMLTDQGILLIHTSNRNYDLPPVLGDVAASLGLSCATAHDMGAGFGPGAAPPAKGHFTSEWVIVARRPEALARVQALLGPAGRNQGIQWSPLRATGRPVWSDASSNSFSELRR
jgi:hypothetical protein